MLLPEAFMQLNLFSPKCVCGWTGSSCRQLRTLPRPPNQLGRGTPSTAFSTPSSTLGLGASTRCPVLIITSRRLCV